MTCPYCKKSELIYVPQDLPYYEEHYICPNCDSTYDVSEVKDDMK